MTNLVLNAAEIILPQPARVIAGMQAYDPDLLRSLRRDDGDRYYFRRDKSGEFERLLSVPLVRDAPPIGETTAEFDLTTSHWLVAPLVIEGLYRALVRWGRPILRAAYPLRMLSIRPPNLIPQDAGLPSWLERRLVLEFDTRTLWNRDGVPQTVLVCSSATRNLINASAAELSAHGISLLGRYVARRRADDFGRTLGTHKLAGRVVGIDGAELVLQDVGDGETRLALAEAFLEPRKENLEWCMGQLAPGRAKRLLERADAAANACLSGPHRLDLLRRTMDYLRDKPLELAPGIPLRLGPLVARSSDTWHMRTETIAKPLLVFDPSGTRTGQWNQGGLDKHGPYDQSWFTPKQVRIAVICQAQHEGKVDEFVAKFLDGMPTTVIGQGSAAKTPYGKGFRRRYALATTKFSTFTTTGTDARAYAEACRNALRAARDDSFEWTLAIVQVDPQFRDLDESINPYYVAKAAFLQQRVAVQEVTTTTIDLPDRQLVYVLNNMSVASYAKIGGVPWLMKSPPRAAHELVIGIGSQDLASGHDRLAEKKRVVGLTTVFTSDGKYLLDDITAAVDYEHYAEELLGSLKRSISKVRQLENWRSSEDVRLIFHVFKEVPDKEAQAVERLVQDMGLAQVKYAFLHIVDDHPFAIFDEDNPGTPVPGGTKGPLAPERGLAVHLGEQQALVFFTSGRELKKPSDGHPLPSLLRLHRQSTFRDMTYLTRQAFNFTCHSWRMFTPAPLPITVHYSELMARLLSGLQKVPGWNQNTLLGAVGRRRWFL